MTAGNERTKPDSFRGAFHATENMKLENHTFITTFITNCTALILILFCILCGCGKESGSAPVMNIDLDANGNAVYNGDEQYFYEVKAGEKAVVHFSVTALSGSVRFDIRDRDDPDRHEYRGTVTESCGFDVVITEESAYRVSVSAKDFHGKYEIGWETVRR